MHTAADHVPSQDESKNLEFRDKSFILDAVEIAQYPSARESLHNVSDLPTKSISIGKNQLSAWSARSVSDLSLYNTKVISWTIHLSSSNLADTLWFGENLQEESHLDANICQTYATAIAKNKF